MSTRGTSDEKQQNAIADLQTRVAFQEDSLQALTKTLVEQNSEILQLRRLVQHLNDKLNEVANAVEQTSGGREPPPPHY